MNKKLIYAGLTVAGIGAAAYLLFNKKSGLLKKKEEAITVTPASTEYLSMANRLQDAMDGYGTDEKAIFNELSKLKSKADWDALVNAYGIRELSSGNFNVFVSNFKGGLIQSLQNELGEKDIQKVNQILNPIGVSI